MSNHLYSKEELYLMGPQRSYKGDAREAAFLLGGIGTENVSIGARGELRDWEIFNRPGKGNYFPYTFFAIWAKPKGEKAVVKVLESKIPHPYSESDGFHSGKVAGLPRLENSTMKGEYPFLWVEFEDKDLPVRVALEAFTPFIPLNADDSGIPGVILRYKVKNISNRDTDVSIVGSLANAVGFEGYDAFKCIKLAGQGKNEYRRDDYIKGLFYTSNVPSKHLTYGSMALMTSQEPVTLKARWLEGGFAGEWADGIQDFWDDFREDGRLEKESSFAALEGELTGKQKLKVGSLGVYHTLSPTEEKVFEFVLSWYFPNRVRGWEYEDCGYSGEYEVVRNYYARLFNDAWEAWGTYSQKIDPRTGEKKWNIEVLYGDLEGSKVISSPPTRSETF